MEKPEGGRQLGGSFEVALALTQTRTIKINGYVYSDDTPAQINERIDVAQDALDRQAIRVDIVVKEAQISGHLANLEAIREGYRELVEKKNKARKLTSQEQANLDNFDPTVRRVTETVESLRAAIAAAKAKLGTPA